MCGIAGLISRGPVDPATVTAMTDAIRHRGPDDGGKWFSQDRRVALGHRRLSIIELSAAGHQPMSSSCGRFVIIFNGEIYNHLDIRRELEAAGRAPAWRGRSDTETLIAAIVAWGLDEALLRVAGMFALALWNLEKQTLAMASDRFGEKPLFYGQIGSGFAFASEVKALRTLPGFCAEIDPDALRGLLGTGYVGSTRSIWQGISRLQPGTIARLTLEDVLTGKSPAISQYYNHREVARQGPIAMDADDAFDELGRLLNQAISRQLIADVPVGCFLSGGIDSSLISSLAAQRIGRSLKTFSIGFEESAYDESPYAAAIARHIGSDHHELIVTPKQAMDVIPLLPTMFDEPFGDSSQIPTYLVSQFARKQVTVCLSGDAGDELFGGYNRYLTLPKLWRKASLLPRPLRLALFSALRTLPPGLWNNAAHLGSGHKRPSFLGNKVQRTLGLVAKSDSFEALFHAFLDEWHGLPDPVPSASETWRSQLPEIGSLAALPLEDQLMLGDISSYLNGDILVKVDRSTMAVGLEGRCPFLDRDVAAFAAQMPTAMKIQGNRSKVPLRDLLNRFVPPALLDRPKAGFAIPIDLWLRGPLRDWAEDLLSPAKLAASGLIDPIPVRRRWQRHLSGEENATQAIWPLLMFQAWLPTN